MPLYPSGGGGSDEIIVVATAEDVPDGTPVGTIVVLTG